MPKLSSTESSPLFSLDALKWAWIRVKQNGGSAGADGITLNRFDRLLEANLLQLADEVRDGSYRPGPVRFVFVQESTKVRRLAILCIRDRVLQRAVLDRMSPPLERRFMPSSFGYRTGLSVRDAVERIVKLRNRGLVFVVDADIRDCFGTIDHVLLLQRVVQHVPNLDQTSLELIKIWLAAPARPRSHRADRPRTVGILQGAPLSPLLCNLYLHEFDRALARRRLSLVRYADDFVVLCRSAEHADRALRTVSKQLRGLRLSLHPGKTSLTSFEQGFGFLGVWFEGDTYSYTTEGKRVAIEGGPPDWFFYHPDEYA